MSTTKYIYDGKQITVVGEFTRSYNKITNIEVFAPNGIDVTVNGKVIHQVTEVHFNYSSLFSGAKVALESDILLTGITMNLNDISHLEFEVTL